MCGIESLDLHSHKQNNSSMNTNLKDKLGMYLKVQDNLMDHASDYASHPRIAGASKELDVKIAAIFEAASRFDLDNTGVTEDKALKRVRLEELVYKVGKALKSLADETPGKTLKNRVTFSLGEIQQMRDADLHLKALQLKQFAQTHITALAEFRILPADIDLLDGVRDEFLVQIPNPKDENEARVVAGIELDTLFAETDILLSKIDDYLDTYRFEQPLLWEEYQLSRSIDQTGSRKQKAGIEGSLAPGQLKEVFNMDYQSGRKFIIRNSGNIPFSFSLNQLNTGMGTYVVELGPDNFKSILSSELNPSSEARYLMLQNNDPINTAKYDINIEELNQQ